MKFVTALFCSFFLPGALYLGCTGGEREVILQFAPIPGQLVIYRQVTDRHVRVFEHDSLSWEQKQKVTTILAQTCIRVIDDSTAEFNERDSMEMIVPNRSDTAKLDTMRNISEQYIYARPNGEVVDIKFKTEIDSSSAAYLRDFFQQALPVFPSRPVKKGESWTQTRVVDFEGKTLTASTRYDLIGFEKRDGYDCAILTYSGEMLLPVREDPADSTHRRGIDRIKIDGKLYFGVEDGTQVYQEENWVIDGDRTRLIKGEQVASKVKILNSTVLRLVELKRPPAL